MIGVYHSSPTNSTHFTECCRTAINDNQEVCPNCKKEIISAALRFSYAMNKDKWRYTK